MTGTTTIAQAPVIQESRTAWAWSESSRSCGNRGLAEAEGLRSGGGGLARRGHRDSCPGRWILGRGPARLRSAAGCPRSLATCPVLRLNQRPSHSLVLARSSAPRCQSPAPKRSAPKLGEEPRGSVNWLQADLTATNADQRRPQLLLGFTHSRGLSEGPCRGIQWSTSFDSPGQSS